MKPRAELALAVLSLASACASPAQQRERDLSDVELLVQRRAGAALPDRYDDGTIAPAVSELLQAPLTEDGAVKIAVLNNREVRATLAELGVASAELVQAGLLGNPVFTANAKFFDGGTEIELGLIASFFDVFFISARKRVAESELEVTKSRVARELVRLAYDVRRAFVLVGASERLLEVEREILRAAQASFDLMNELHKAGNVTDPVLTAEEIALARAQRAVDEAQASVLESREPLNVLLGLSAEALEWSVEGALGDDAIVGIGDEDFASRARAASFDMAENRAWARAEARRAGLIGWENVFSSGEIGIVAKKEVNASDWGIGPALGVSLPVFDGGSARRARSHALLEHALAKERALGVEIDSAARQLHERARSANARATSIREVELPLAARLVRETLRNYNAMQIGVFDVLLARQQQSEAARSYVETLREAWLARMDLEELLAGSLNRARIAAEPAASGHSSAAPMKAGH